MCALAASAPLFPHPAPLQVSKEERALQHELEEAEAVHSKEERQRLVRARPLATRSRDWGRARHAFPRGSRPLGRQRRCARTPSQHTETLKLVFHCYFRVLKNMQRTPLLMAVLKGLGRSGSRGLHKRREGCSRDQAGPPILIRSIV